MYSFAMFPIDGLELRRWTDAGDVILDPLVQLADDLLGPGIALRAGARRWLPAARLREGRADRIWASGSAREIFPRKITDDVSISPPLLCRRSNVDICCYIRFQVQLLLDHLGCSILDALVPGPGRLAGDGASCRI